MRRLHPASSLVLRRVDQSRKKDLMSEPGNKSFRYLTLLLVAAVVGIAAGDAPVSVGLKVCQVQFRAGAFGLPPITPDPTSIIEIARENRATVTGMLKQTPF
jgi:hypothetical protein